MTIALLSAYFAAFCVLAVFSLHRCWLLRLHRRLPLDQPRNAPATLPTVTIQLPIYNERFVVQRLLRAVFDIDYPHQLLQIQILDDSTDDTTAVIQQTIEQIGPVDLSIVHMRRNGREGFKAGALAHGARSARGEYTLILDADFVPNSALLHELLPPLADPAVAMVQARWTHVNRRANRLTEAQALLLDAHFLIETTARYRAGLFFNFHGTAGLWRSSAIADAGGWQADTLTEDLDLSYRAQLRGWRLVFLPAVAVPAELPESLAAFKQQQARWAEGTMATARKHLRTVLRGRLPLRIKFEACMHLLAHTIYPATLLLALLALPALVVRGAADQPLLLLIDFALALCVIVPTRMFYRAAARQAGTRIPGLRDFPYLTLTGIALAVSNSRAVWAGLFKQRNQFVRTPKFAAAERGMRLSYHVRSGGLLRLVEAGMAAYLILGAILAAQTGMPIAVPMLSFFALAFGVTSAKG